MRKLGLILLGAAIAFPLGALTSGALAERRHVDLSPLSGWRGIPPDTDYRHLAKADEALHEAMNEIMASERAQEGIWADRSGRAKDARETIEKTVDKIDRLIDWARPPDREELPR